MTGVEHFAPIAHHILDQLRPKETDMASAADVQQHELELIRDVQRGRGWHLAWRCTRKGCDARGNVTTPRREKALELFALVAEGHRQIEDAA